MSLNKLKLEPIDSLSVNYFSESTFRQPDIDRRLEILNQLRNDHLHKEEIESS